MVTLGLGFLAIPICMGGMPADRRNTSAYPLPTWPLKIPASLQDEQVLFLSDIFPTGYMAAENCSIQRGDTVAVWGCGPVGQFAIRSAYMLGADHVIAIDRIPERLQMARTQHQATILDYQEVDVSDALQDLTGRTWPRCLY